MEQPSPARTDAQRAASRRNGRPLRRPRHAWALARGV